LIGVVESQSCLEALSTFPRSRRADAGPLAVSWADESCGADPLLEVIPVTDERDWHNQIHVGRRFMRVGRVDPPELINV
jgi:CRISPR system Cascade subunit CasD